MARLIFNAPGQADALSQNLLEKWNQEIERQYNELAQGSLASDFFKLNPGDIPNSITVNTIKWFADPAEPAFCQNSEVAKKLSDWGIKGRHLLHNEYCEYTVEYKADQTGKLRPKRVQVTTELREYWAIIAVHEPDTLRQLATTVLERPVTWIELYGGDPATMTEEQRFVNFSKLVAGNGYDKRLQALGVPDQPTGALNTENALFMTHPINGLDDLIYIVLFGAQPYARKNGAAFQKVKKEAIFKFAEVTHLACRHADPAAAMGAYNAVFEGRSVAFNQNLGMYITSFSKNSFLYNGNHLPEAWVRLSRGAAGMNQRLVFGPADNEDVFLDEITVEIGGVDVNLTGGFDIVQHIEVGPLVQVGPPTTLSDNDYVLVTTTDDAIRCSEAGVCTSIQDLLDQYNQGSLVEKVGPRNIKFNFA